MRRGPCRRRADARARPRRPRSPRRGGFRANSSASLPNRSSRDSRRQMAAQILGELAQRVLKRLRLLRPPAPSARAVRAIGSLDAASAARGSTQASSILSIQVLPSVGADPPRLLRERVGVATQPPGERRRARERQTRDEMLARRSGARLFERRLDPLQRRPPVLDAWRDRPKRAGTRRRWSGAPRAQSNGRRRSSTSVADFGPASLMSRPCGLPGITIVALPCSTNR